MSYPKSPTPTPSEAAVALQAALVQVCENSCFAFVEPCEADRFAENVKQLERSHRGAVGKAVATPATSSIWLKASVTFIGCFAGAIEIVVPEPLARSLVASLIGLAADEPSAIPMSEHQLFDGLGEFANMVCGAWLTDLSGSGAFELGSPAVTRMAPDWSPVTDWGQQDEGGYRLCVNDVPVRIRVRFSTD
jgi:hypothetical protein